jgi:hypothetical protein
MVGWSSLKLLLNSGSRICHIQARNPSASSASSLNLNYTATRSGKVTGRFSICAALPRITADMAE